MFTTLSYFFSSISCQNGPSSAIAPGNSLKTTFGFPIHLLKVQILLASLKKQAHQLNVLLAQRILSKERRMFQSFQGIVLMTTGLYVLK